MVHTYTHGQNTHTHKIRYILKANVYFLWGTEMNSITSVKSSSDVHSSYCCNGLAQIQWLTKIHTHFLIVKEARGLKTFH